MNIEKCANKNCGSYICTNNGQVKKPHIRIGSDYFCNNLCLEFAEPRIFFFKVVHMKGNVYTNHEEDQLFILRDEAHRHFRELLNKFKVDGQSYYLCQWGLKTEETYTSQ